MSREVKDVKVGQVYEFFNIMRNKFYSMYKVIHYNEKTDKFTIQWLKSGIKDVYPKEHIITDRLLSKLERLLYGIEE